MMVIFTVAVFVQPCAEIPVTVYVVVTLGLATTRLPVVGPVIAVAGAQVKLCAVLSNDSADNMVVLP
jgi:hypothetical protein